LSGAPAGSGRADGRALDELRPVRLVPNFTESPLASVLCEIGRTRVLCTVSEEGRVPRWLEGAGRGWVTAEYSMLPGATRPRSEREAARGRLSGRTQEIQRLIGRSLRAVVDLAALGPRTLWVDCDVLQADGGTRCASITGAWAALALGVRRLRRSGTLDGDPLRDAVAAVSAGIVDSRPVVDLAYQEDSRAQVDLNLVATGSGRLVEVQATGEQATFTTGELEAMQGLALRGIARLCELQRAAVEAGDPA
jgi:ribonuclease PH